MYPFTDFYLWSPIYLIQIAMTVWMLVDASRRGVEFYWFWIILGAQPFGAWVYFFLYKVKDFQDGGAPGWLANIFHRRPSLEELRHRAVQLPTVANRLELGERLVEEGSFDEALPHIEAMLAREPEHCRSLFLLAEAHRGLGHPEEAVPLLQKLLARQPAWNDYAAWRMLIQVCEETGDLPGALTRCRELARMAPSLEHKCLLAERLLERGESSEARRVVEQGLDDYRYTTGPSRRRDSRWVGKARQLLKQVE
jgi:hypothetical protein